MRHLILVNGLPGAGKSTLAGRLAAELQAPVLSKDVVKEALADALSDSAIPRTALGAAAMESVWTIAAQAEGPLLIDSWWFRPRDLAFARAGLERARADSAVEIWCEVPSDVARERCAERDRHPVHADSRDLSREWAAWSAGADPLALCPVVRVDTTSLVDVSELASRVAALLASS